MDVISLFSGSGGMDLGFVMAGHRIIYAIDNDLDACSTYEINLKFKPVCENIKKIDNFPEADIMLACCPCQGFSLFGTRNFYDERNFLYKEIIRCLNLVNPKFVIIENVKGLLSLYKRKFFDMMVSELTKVGYKISWKLLDAKDYGVPQDRLRLFIVGVRTDLAFKYKFPLKTHGPKIYSYITLRQEKDGTLKCIYDNERNGQVIRPYVTLKKAIGDLKQPKKGEYWDDNKYSPFYMSRNRRRTWNQVSYTIQASGRHAPLHPSSPPMKRIAKDKWIFTDDVEKYRRMSIKECARIQTFPDNYHFEGNIKSQYRQIGNAVPPKLAYCLAVSFNFLEGQVTRTTPEIMEYVPEILMKPNKITQYENYET